MLRQKLSKFGMATAGVAVGAVMAISLVFAQGNGSTTTTSGNATLLADILAAVSAAGITLTAEQQSELAQMVADITTQGVTEQGTANDIDEEEVDEDEDDTAEVAAATTTKSETKHTVTITFTAPKSSEESKGDD